MLGGSCARRLTPFWVGGDIGKSLLLPELRVHREDAPGGIELRAKCSTTSGDMHWSPHVAVVTMLAPIISTAEGTRSTTTPS